MSAIHYLADSSHLGHVSLHHDYIGIRYRLAVADTDRKYWCCCRYATDRDLVSDYWCFGSFSAAAVSGYCGILDCCFRPAVNENI